MNDLISREDAIKVVAVAVLDDKDEIEAIKAIPSVQVSGDLISRADAIKALRIEYEAVLNCEEDPTIWNYKECAIDRLYALPSAENSNAKTQNSNQETQNSNQETQKSNGDLIYRADAKQQISEWATIITKPTLLDKDATMVVLDSLSSAEAVEAVKDCRNCRHGGYNDHWKTWFCYNNLECSNGDLWESAEAVQGEWVKEIHHHKDDEQEFDYYDIHCSVCGAKPQKSWALTNYCPDCGAKMTKGGGEE